MSRTHEEKVGLFKEKIVLVTDRDLIKCLKQIKKTESARLFLNYHLITLQYFLTCSEHDVFGQVLEVACGPLPGGRSLQLVAGHLEQGSLLLLSNTATRKVDTILCSYSA